MLEHKGPQLAIVIPTFRFDALAKDVLTQAATIGSDDIIVHIADNSENEEKHAFLAKLAARGTNVIVTCHQKNIGPEANWLYLIKAQTAPYVCIAADDDCFGATYFRSGLELVLTDPHCSAASGLHLSVAHLPHRTIPAMYSPAERLEVDPLARIRKYRGENAMAYTISKHSIIRGFADYVERNPLKCPFNDYILAFHLLSIGTYRLNRRGYVYVYDNTNWQLNDSFIGSHSRWYKGFGLPEGFGFLVRLHWAVVTVHFFSSIFRSPDLGDERAAAIVSYLFNRQRREFQRDFYRYRTKIGPLFEGHGDAAEACTHLMSSRYDRVAPVFDDFARVVAAFSPEAARRYREFQTATLLNQAEAITPPASGVSKSLAMAEATTGNFLRSRFGWFP